MPRLCSAYVAVVTLSLDSNVSALQVSAISYAINPYMLSAANDIASEVLELLGCPTPTPTPTSPTLPPTPTPTLPLTRCSSCA